MEKVNVVPTSTDKDGKVGDFGFWRFDRKEGKGEPKIEVTPVVPVVKKEMTFGEYRNSLS